MNTSLSDWQFNRFAISTEFSPGTNHATLSDLLVITPTAKTIRIIAAYICAVQSGAGNPRFRLIRRTTANAGGASTVLTPAPWDSKTPTSWTKVEQYTAHPTSVGDAAATFRTTPIQFASGGLHSGVEQWPLTFDAGMKRVTVHPGEFLAINAAGLDSGASLQCSIFFDEDE